MSGDCGCDGVSGRSLSCDGVRRRRKSCLRDGGGDGGPWSDDDAHCCAVCVCVCVCVCAVEKRRLGAMLSLSVA